MAQIIELKQSPNPISFNCSYAGETPRDGTSPAKLLLRCGSIRVHDRSPSPRSSHEPPPPNPRLHLPIPLTTGAAQAQQFPTKPIRIIIPFTPGGTNDILARTLGPKLSEALGQPVLVENRPGGNTVIASQALLASDKDGHKMLLPGNSHVVVPHLAKTPLPFHSINDFQPVATLARTGLFLVVRPGDTDQAFVAAA